MSKPNPLVLHRLTEHRDDIRSALLVLELIEDTDSEARAENLLNLGKLALGSKLELLDDIIAGAADRDC